MKILNLQILVAVISFGVLQSSCHSVNDTQVIVQAHRGGAALYPENTIPAMINAVKIGTKTLELDLQITRDSQVVVSHDSYLNSMKALFLDGSSIPKELESKLQIYNLDYDSICQFDVGTLKTPLYPSRKNLYCVIPTLTNLIDCVESYTSSRGLEPVNYNIEIKSGVEKDEKITPAYQTFCDLSLRVLLGKNIKSRLCIQSFDSRTLNYIHQKYPGISLSYLVEETDVTVSTLLKKLDFVPDIISPLHSIVDDKFVSEAHDYAMKVIPWTVDTQEEVLRLKAIGIDEIITNIPDSVQSWLAMDGNKTKYMKAVEFFENLMGY